MFWYRFILLGLAWVPACWWLFALSLREAKPDWTARVLLLWGLTASAALLFIDHPAIYAAPLELLSQSGVRRPQSWLLRPAIYGVALAVNLASILMIWLRWWRPPRPGYILFLTTGLALWLAGGLHDAAFALGWRSPLGGTVLWLVSACLSICMALTVALQMRHLENQLSASQEHFVKAFQFSPNWMVVSNLEDGRFLEVNEAFLRDIGFKREDFIGRTSLDLGLWLDPEQRREGIQQLLEQGALREKEITVSPQKGSRLTLAWSGGIIEWGGQKALLSVLHDITQRKQAEEELNRNRSLLEQEVGRRTAELLSANEELHREIQERERTESALRESQGNLQRLFDSMQDLLFILSPGGHVLHANQRAVERLGYSLEELRGMYILSLHPPARRQEAGYVMEDLIAGRSDTCLVPLYTKRGETIPVETKVTQGRWGPKEALFGISRDVSERLRAEETLNQLTAGVAHNFNNLLAAVMGNAQAARSELDKPSRNQTSLRRLLDNVVRSAEGGRGLVQRLTAYVGRRQPGNALRQTVNLAEVLASSVEIAKAAFRHMGMSTVKVRLDLEESLHVEAQRSELMEVFLNLIKNAVEAMPDGGSLTIKAWRDGGRAQASFSDTGTGMNEETRSRVFQPFFSTKGVSGQGLGLASSRGILRSLGGDITAYSQPNRGATINLRLPLCEASPGQAAKNRAQVIDRGLEVLLVEDEALVAMGLTATLEDAGLKVSLASRLSEAYAHLEHGSPDILLCDLGLPDGTGWDVASRFGELAQSRGRETPPVILLTGWAAESVWERPPQGATPVFAILHKPVDRALLLDTVSKALNHGQKTATR
ncbi:hypothetical protein AAU61_08350 [Desulfocarbo indianensis]|nr:hypothetical protein AAU61_08350 [Desulfocarbo indianensis]